MSLNEHFTYYGPPKKKYTEAEAYRVAEDMTLNIGEAFQAYECSFCSGWHIGHA